MTNCSGVKDVVNAGAVCLRVCCANNKSARELFGSGKWIAVCKIAKPHVWPVCKGLCLAVGSGPIEPGQFGATFLLSRPRPERAFGSDKGSICLHFCRLRKLGRAPSALQS